MENISVTGTSVGDEERDEQSTVDDLDNTLDLYLGNGPLDCGIAREVTWTDYSSIEDTPSMVVHGTYMAANQTQSSIVSAHSSTNSYDKNSRAIIEETKRLAVEAEELREAIRLAKHKEQVDTTNYVSNKGNFLKKAWPVPASKLVIESPTPLMRDITLGRDRDHNPKVQTSAEEKLTSKLLLMKVANSKAMQINLANQRERLRAQLALERRAEKKARREAKIAMKQEKQERRREIKAAAKVRKLLRKQQRAKETAAAISADKLIKAQIKKKKKEDEVAAMKEALALATGRRARNINERDSTKSPYQKKTRGYDMPGYKKKTRRARFPDFSVSVDDHDNNYEYTADKPRDVRIMQKEILELKETVSRLQGEEEAREEANGIGSSIANFFLCRGVPCALSCNNGSRSEMSSCLQRSKASKGRRLKQRRSKQKKTISSPQAAYKKDLRRTRLGNYYLV
ncbi:hypothetical protein ACHAXA_005501 [Cyclostephanos tholiformis]|uniref:Uncharacterized protein n=1 Tax=Cyclostephanos tholiformis TaxID=382380 RepID=A0ABD3RBM3_9STRA